MFDILKISNWCWDFPMALMRGNRGLRKELVEDFSERSMGRLVGI